MRNLDLLDILKLYEFGRHLAQFRPISCDRPLKQMSSDEVINQIIRTIVQKSSRVLEEAGDVSGIGAENHEANKAKSKLEI